MDAAGKKTKEIMSLTGLGRASVYSYLPYKKGAYNLADPTLYSEQGKRYRERKNTVRELNDHLVKERHIDDTAKLLLWRCIIAFEEYPFQTTGRGKKICRIDDEGAQRLTEISPEGTCEIKIKKLVRLIYQTCGWKKDLTYRVPGRFIRREHLVNYDLSDARELHQWRLTGSK